MSGREPPRLVRLVRPNILAVLVAALSGCIGPRSTRFTPLTDSSRREIYERVGGTFTNAIIFKPLDTGSADALGFAPLIILEAAGNDVQRWSVNAGSAQMSNQIPSLPGVLTTVYFGRTKAWIHGRPHDQVTYLWRYPDWTPPKADSEWRIQGVRITLDSAQQPVIWEIARDTSREEIIFVSHSIERAAVWEYGGPLPGRRFAVENDLGQAPGTIVAGVVNSTPVPMGPMVYIQAATKDISTIACRCSPAPTRKFIAQGYYALSTNLDTGTNPLLSSERERGPGAGFWAKEWSESGRLEHCLRLPKDF